MNHPYLVTLAAIAVLVACGTSGVVDDDDTDTDDSQADTEGTDETGLDETGADDTAREVTPPFSSARYQASELRVLPSDRGLDLTGDGVADNKIAVVLEIVNNTLGSGFGLSLDDVNARIAAMLSEERAIILVEAEATDEDGALRLDVVRGERDGGGDLIAVGDDYDENGDPTQRMTGRFTSTSTFTAGPGPLAIPVQFYSDEPVIMISAAEAQIFGDIETREIDAKIAGVFLIDEVMAGMVEPLIETYFGVGSTADGWNSTIRAVLELQADLEVGGKPALSGAFAMVAEGADWQDPVQP